MKKIVFLSTILFSPASLVLAAGAPLPPINPSPMTIPQLAQTIYYFILGISGALAMLRIVWGGFNWIISGGDPNKVSEAKEIIKSAFVGIIIIIAAFIVLGIINPQLRQFKVPSLTNYQQPNPPQYHPRHQLAIIVSLGIRFNNNPPF